MTDIKQICARLIELWDADCDINVEINELRAALAEPEPEEPADTELETPKAYRLIMRGDGNGNTLPALQGLFTWTEGSNYGAEWRTLETQECPYLDDSIPFGPIH